MKNEGTTEKIKGLKPGKNEPPPHILQQQVEHYKKENDILLALSNDITQVREKNDLIKIFSSRLKSFFQFTHAVIGLVDRKNKVYYPFLMETETHPAKGHIDFNAVITKKYPLDDPFIGRILTSPDQATILLEDVLNEPGIPEFIRVNYEFGIKSALITPLKNKMELLGYVYISSKQTDNFPDDFKSILQGIAPHLSSAVSNIIANEEISKKHEEQTFLLDFSTDIAQVRTRPELQAAIFKVLDKTMHTQLAMIRVIEDDDFHLYPFMYDSSLFEKIRTNFEELVTGRININEPYTARVLASKDGLVFNVDEELKSGNSYAKLWKTTGLKNMYSLPLRVGNKNLGTIWILANQLSTSMLKGVSAQISVAIANIQANEKLLANKKQLEGENDYLREQIQTIYNFSDIIGDGPQMQNVYHLMSMVSGSNSTVLLLGETGTGKELIARAIHNSSPRKNKLMVKVNCAALPPNLIESELFGHEKGAFTGAIERRIGKFELANNSTLFLDEIGEMPLETQVKFLRVLQERELERVGGKTTIKVDVRIIAATNRNLENEVKAGRFRSDLYYRLNVFPITLPPLRDRREDIVPLANFFLARYSKNSGKNVTSISGKCLEELKNYSWPGNVRELEHLIERGILLTQGNVLTEVQLPKSLNEQKNDQSDVSNKTLQQLERAYIIEVLKRCSGKISGNGGAAAALEIPSTTLHSKMKKLGISKADYFQNQD